MAMNGVQFQRVLLMTAFLKEYGTEEQCERALEASRWAQGFRCPICRGSRCSRYEREGRWQCGDCRHQTTVTSGTIFEATELPLTTWFLEMHLLTQSKNNVSALELKRHLGVSYPTVWAIKHRLLQVLVDREEGLVWKGRVDIDDAYLGGEHAGTPGQGSENKVPFVAAVQSTADGKPQKVCLKAMRFTKASLSEWARQTLAPDAEVYSDALPGMKAGLAAEVLNYHAIRTNSGRKAVQHPEFRCAHTVLSNLKTAISSTCHAFNFAKYADRSLAKVQYRFNRRFDLSVILRRLLRAAATTRPYPVPVLKIPEVR
jgi:transposase-like protein